MQYVPTDTKIIGKKIFRWRYDGLSNGWGFVQLMRGCPTDDGVWVCVLEV